MSNAQQNPDLTADELFAALEAEEDVTEPTFNSGYRAARLQQLNKELQESRNPNQPRDSGATSSSYKTLKSDPEVLTFTTENKRAILHFFHPDFARCAAMDTHLEKIARAHTDGSQNQRTIFGRVDVKDAQFVVTKMAVRVLPCVIGFVDGVAKEKITGFEGLVLGGDERSDRVTRKIENLFFKASILAERKIGDEDDERASEDEEDEVQEENGGRGGWGVKRGITGRKQQVEDSDDDWD